MKKNKLYTKDSIESLSPLEFTRLRPGVYAGDTTYATQLLVEIISNTIDEFNLGHGSTVDVSINGNIVSVKDFGQGFLVNEFREDGKTILEAAFSVLNTSGKYREDGVYEGTSLGSFGLGAKITTFLSHWLSVETHRDKKYERIHFKEGVFDEREVGNWLDNTSGTLVAWQASEEFFTHPEVEINKIKNLFRTITCLCPGLTINLNDNGTQTQYYSVNGLNDLVDDLVKDKELIDNRCSIKFEEGKNKMDFILTYTSEYGSRLIPYVNTGLTEKGPHMVVVKSLITREFNKFFREKKWLKEKEDNLTGEDIQEGMYIVFNITAPGVAYDAQVKSTVTKIDMTPFSNRLTEELTLWMENHEKDIKLIADKALAARRAREAAQKAREKAREGTTTKRSSTLNLPTKLIDAWSKKRSDCELLIAEGDSAAGGLIGARDGETQAIFPVRGKVLNLFKATSERAFANQEVANIIKALGLTMNPVTHQLIYEPSKLRYGKIIMCCDGDPDGASIKNLLLTCLWSLCPELIINGHVYAAVPPLFRITTTKNEYIFLRNAQALEEYKLQHPKEKYLVNRNKGLGEQDADELEECLLNPATRNVMQITVNDIKESERLLNIFMGNDASLRRDYILEQEAQNDYGE